MLKLAESNDLKSIISFCEGILLGTRIGCYCLAYGFDRDFLNVWIDNCEGEINTVIAKFYDSMTVITSSDNVDEIKEFILMMGFNSLETDVKICNKLSFKADSVKKAYIFDGGAESFGAKDLGEEYYKALYDLVCENISGSFANSKEAYLSFVSDFTFRKSRSLARSKGFTVNDMLVSSVITSAETETCALLSAVASDISVRGKGYGKRTVLSMVDELLKENKMVFVIALNESAESFYEHLGFKFYGEIANIKS
jgi:hypothetical protein